MVPVKRILFGTLAAGALLALSGCPSPFLAAIKTAIANAPFNGNSYAFVRQYGNPHPEWTFNNPVVKTDTAGYVYVADSSYRIRKFTGSGSLVNTVSGISQQGTNARIYDMAFDSAGNMYITTNDTYQVQKYDLNGNRLAQWAQKTVDTYGGLAIVTPRGIAVDSSGNVYVVDAGANNRIVKFNSSGTYQTSWGGATTYGTLAVALSSPYGIAVSGSNLYVVDSGNHRVVEFGSTGSYVTDWGGGAAALYPPTTGTTMSGPQGVSVGKSGFTTYVYVADTGYDRIIQFSTSGSYSTTWGSSSTFSSPGSLAIDTSGFVYVADSSGFGGRIQKYDVSSTPNLVATWGGSLGTGTDVAYTPWGVGFDSSGNVVVSEVFNGRLHAFTGAGAPLWATAGGLSVPTGLTIDSSGKIYVTEFGGSKYDVYDSSGNPLTTVGSAGSGNGSFNSPVGIAHDASGNLYVSDAGLKSIQVFTSGGYYANLQWTVATTNSNYCVAVDPAGYVYVSDYQANTVTKYDLQGNLVSSMGTFGSGDGQFNAPMGMVVDKLGNLFVCDMMNHRVQKFNSAGVFMGKFGGPGAGNGRFGWPVGIAINSAGHVVVTDYVGSLIQEFEPTF